MAAGDSRSRNKRNRTTTTKTSRQKYQKWEKTGEGEIPNLNPGRPAPMPGRSLDEARTVDGEKYTRASRDGKYLYRIKQAASESVEGSLTKYDAAEIVDKTDVTHSSSTGYSPKDQRDADSKDDSKSKKASLKKKGRSGLRIKLQADPSAGRLKNQKGGKKDKKSGAQGGGKSGLNIPR